MKTDQEWLDQYAQTHQNLLNKKIHSVCVPLIYWSIFAALWHLQPFAALAVFGLISVFYALLGIRYCAIMFLFSFFVLGSAAAMEALRLPVLALAVGVFVAAWIGQFYGHKIEGKKPAFFEDLLFLLIGPLWVLKYLKFL